jgi:hypothetical protein
MECSSTAIKSKRMKQKFKEPLVSKDTKNSIGKY